MSDTPIAAGLFQAVAAQNEWQRQAQAATIDPLRVAGLFGAMAGQSVGAAIPDLAAGLTGDMSMASDAAKQRYIGSMPFDNLNNPVDMYTELASRYQKLGMTPQALMAATAAQQQRLGEAKSMWDIAHKQSEITKNLREADPAEKAFGAGKITPESYAKYKQSGKVSDLVLADPDQYGTVETGAGVLAFNKRDPKDTFLLGSNKPVRNPGAMDPEKLAQFNALMKEAEASGDPDAFFEANPDKMRTAGALAKELYGADNAPGYMPYGSGAGALTEGQNKLITYADAAKKGMEIYKSKGWGKSRQLPDLNKALAIITQIATQDPNKPLSLNALVTAIPDREVQEYLADAMGVLLPVLRQDTGAAIAAGEWVNYMTTMIPMSNANPSDNKSRMERMDSRVEGLIKAVNADARTRKAWRNMNKPPKDAPKPAASDGAIDRQAMYDRGMALLAKINAGQGTPADIAEYKALQAKLRERK